MKKILLITHDTSLSGAPKSILLVFEHGQRMHIRLILVRLPPFQVESKGFVCFCQRIPKKIAKI